MSQLGNAIEEMESRIAAYNPGVQKHQPQENSTEYFELRGFVIALAYMRRVQTLGIESNPSACERLYKACIKTFKQAEVPPAAEIERERLPDGSLPSAVV